VYSNYTKQEQVVDYIAWSVRNNKCSVDVFPTGEYSIYMGNMGRLNVYRIFPDHTTVSTGQEKQFPMPFTA
jgi:hypothetical protein